MELTGGLLKSPDHTLGASNADFPLILICYGLGK